MSSPFSSTIFLSHKQDENSIAQLTIDLVEGQLTTMANESLEVLRSDNPAARALPLLASIAQGGGECLLPYQDEQLLKVEVSACN